MNRLFCVLFVILSCLLPFTPSAQTKSWDVSPPGPIHIPPPHPPPPPKLKATVTFSEPSGNNILDAEETAHFIVKVTNEGKEGDAYEVTTLLLQLEGPNHLQYQRKTLLGSIRPGKFVERKIPITAKRQIESGKVRFRVEFLEMNGFDAPPIVKGFSTREFLYPELVVVQYLVDAGDNYSIDLGEEVGLSLVVENKGKGKAEAVEANFFLEDKNVKPLSGASQGLRDLDPGAWEEIRFQFIATYRFKGDTILLPVRLTEKRSNKSFEKLLELPVNEYIPPQDEEEPDDEVITQEEEIMVKPVSDVDQFILDQPAVNPDKKKWALILGIERYKCIYQLARFAVRDAVVVKEYLVKLLGVPRDHVMFLYNENATLTDIRVTLEDRLKGQVEKGDILYFYYAGHGVPGIKEGRPNLLPYNGYPKSIEISGYPLARVYEVLGELPASRIIAFIDSCFSGIDLDIRDVIRVPKVPVNARNVCIFSAAKSDQVSNCLEDERHGMFTYYLLKGLSGQADRNKDNELRIGELYDYVKENVQKQSRRISTRRHQSPEITPSLKKRGDWVILRTRDGQRRK